MQGVSLIKARRAATKHEEARDLQRLLLNARHMPLCLTYRTPFYENHYPLLNVDDPACKLHTIRNRSIGGQPIHRNFSTAVRPRRFVTGRNPPKKVHAQHLGGQRRLSLRALAPWTTHPAHASAVAPRSRVRSARHARALSYRPITETTSFAGRAAAALPSTSASTSSTSRSARAWARRSARSRRTPTSSTTLARVRQPRRRLALPGTLRSLTARRPLINTALYDHCPEVVEAFVARGDELIGHGHTNAERQGDLAEDGERALLRALPRTHRRETGTPRPAGSRPGSRRARRRPTCWPRRATATRSTGATTTSRAPAHAQRRRCGRSPTRRNSTTSR